MKRKRNYPKHSWIDPRIEVRESKVDGKGLFAKKQIKAGEVVEKFGGLLFTEEEVQQGKHRPNSLIAVDEGLYLGLAKDTKNVSIDEYTNHSCDPSAWLADEITLVARKNIQPGEEITMDYGTWEPDETYVYFTNCHCGSKFCRKKVTGSDWKLPELQERYKGHFSPFIQRRIEKVETNL